MNSELPLMIFEWKPSPAEVASALTTNIELGMQPIWGLVFNEIHY